MTYLASSIYEMPHSFMAYDLVQSTCHSEKARLFGRLLCPTPSDATNYSEARLKMENDFLTENI